MGFVVDKVTVWGKESERYGRTGRQSPRSGRINILNKKKIAFLCWTEFKLLSQIKWKSLSNCNFLKPINSVRGGHGYYVLGRQNLFTPPVSRTGLRARPWSPLFRKCSKFVCLSLRQALSTRSSWATCCQRHSAVVSRALTFEMRERLLSLSLA